MAETSGSTAPDGTLGWLIDKAVEWELMARDTYASLSKSFVSQPAIRDFWREMSLEEAHHAEVCVAARRALPQRRLAEAVDAKARKDARAIDALWARVRDGHFETLDDAYEAAQELEGSEINSVFRFVALGLYDDAAKRAMLEAQLEQHVGGLEEFGRTYDRVLRKSIPIRPVGDDAG